MIVLNDKSLSSFVKLLLDFIFFIGISVFVSLPWSVKWYANLSYRDLTSTQYSYLLILLYVTGALALWIVFELRKVFKTLVTHTPFVMENVSSLQRMAISSFVIALCYISKIFFYNSFFTPILIMMFVVAGLFCLVLAEVFKAATLIKEENDFTI